MLTTIVSAALLIGPPKWVKLFNGKNLSDWTPKIRGYAAGNNFGNTFRVKDGVIAVVYDGYDGRFGDRFGHLFYKEKLSKYRLRLEYRFLGDKLLDAPGWAWRNSGVMVHGQSAKSMGIDQSFPVSIEFQFLGGDGRETRATGNLCTPGTNVVIDGKLVTQHVVDSTGPTVHGDAWVKAEIHVDGGNRITHYINDKKVHEYEKPQYDERDADAKKLIVGKNLVIESGTISLQSEGHPIEFRNIELMKLR